MERRFFLGIDVNGDDAITASIVEKRREDDARTSVYRIERVDSFSEDEEAVERVKNLIARDPYVGNTAYVVNSSTRHGRQLLRQMTAEGLSPLAIAVNGGDGASADGPGIQTTSDENNTGFSVDERSLIYNLIGHDDDGTLQAQDVRLKDSLVAYRERESEEQEAPEPTESDHDELLISVALACWVGDQQAMDPTEHLGGAPPTTGPAKRMWRPDG